MSLESLRVLVPEALGEAVQAALSVSAAGPFDVITLPPGAAFDAGDFDAVLMPQSTGLTDLPAHAAATALVVVAEGEDAAPLVGWLRQGAADVIGAHDLRSPGFGARLRVAVERRRIEREARQAYATDLATGLPHRQQLVEHMSHLIALRERQPAPMAVLVLRIEGFESVSARFGREAANVLRRNGIQAAVVRKITERSGDHQHVEEERTIADLILDGEIAMIINTVEDRRTAIQDSYSIRRSALQGRVTYYTTIAGARAACTGMENMRELTAYSVQSLHARLQ